MVKEAGKKHKTYKITITYKNKIIHYTAEGNTKLDAIHDLPKNILEAVYREASDYVQGNIEPFASTTFEDTEEMNAEEEKAYEEALEQAERDYLEKALWSHCDQNNMTVTWEEVKD